MLDTDSATMTNDAMLIEHCILCRTTLSHESHQEQPESHPQIARQHVKHHKLRLSKHDSD